MQIGALTMQSKNPFRPHTPDDDPEPGTPGTGDDVCPECEGTGKQKTMEDYLNRAASFGKDARGGGMAMLLATELDEAGIKSGSSPF